jgi:hypothetical protein
MEDANRERTLVFRCSHNQPPEMKQARSLTLLRLRRFPRFHSGHHNNKSDLV